MSMAFGCWYWILLLDIRVGIKFCDIHSDICICYYSWFACTCNVGKRSMYHPQSRHHPSHMWVVCVMWHTRPRLYVGPTLQGMNSWNANCVRPRSSAMNLWFCEFCAIRWRGQLRRKGRRVGAHKGSHSYPIGVRAHDLLVLVRFLKTSYKNPRNDVYIHQHLVTLCACSSRPIFLAN